MLKVFTWKYFYQTLFVGIVIAGIFIYHWLFYDYPYTRDGLLYANVASINSVVSGNTVKIYVRDNMLVKKGQPLITIDPRPYQYALEKATAELNAAKLNYKSAQNNVRNAEDKLAIKTSGFNLAQTQFNRIKELYEKQAVSQIKYLEAKANLSATQAEKKAAQEILLVAKRQLNDTQIKSAEATYLKALYNLNHTTIYAPFGGYLTNFFLVVGGYVNAGDLLFGIIKKEKWWAIGRYRETVLRKIHVNDKVNIYVDMYPKKIFHGIVESIGWGINRRTTSPYAATSPLPYMEPTEDWIRIAQRFPVWVHITDLDPKLPFRVGANARIKVITSHHNN